MCTKYLLSIHVSMIFASRRAYLCPMQFLIPAENGVNANGLRSFVCSGENLSGINFSGSGKTLGSRCKWYISSAMSQFFGTSLPGIHANGQ